jgi:hypothetical protein
MLIPFGRLIVMALLLVFMIGEKVMGQCSSGSCAPAASSSFARGRVFGRLFTGRSAPMASYAPAYAPSVSYSVGLPQAYPPPPPAYQPVASYAVQASPGYVCGPDGCRIVEAAPAASYATPGPAVAAPVFIPAAEPPPAPAPVKPKKRAPSVYLAAFASSPVPLPDAGD